MGLVDPLGLSSTTSGNILNATDQAVLDLSSFASLGQFGGQPLSPGLSIAAAVAAAENPVVLGFSAAAPAEGPTMGSVITVAASSAGTIDGELGPQVNSVNPNGMQLVGSYFFSGSRITAALAGALGMSRQSLGNAIESIKGANGLGGADNVQIHVATGNVFFNGEYIGNVFDEDQ